MRQCRVILSILRTLLSEARVNFRKRKQNVAEAMNDRSTTMGVNQWGVFTGDRFDYPMRTDGGIRSVKPLLHYSILATIENHPGNDFMSD